MAELSFIQYGGASKVLDAYELGLVTKTNVVIYCDDEDLGNTIYASRLINSTIRQIYMPHDGTVGNTMKKVNNLSAIPDSMFNDLSKVREEL